MVTRRRYNLTIGSGLLLILLFASLPARAENPFLQQAVNAYENFEFEKALRILQLADKHSGSTEADRAQVYLYLGLTRYTLGDKRQAEKEFAKALKLDYKIRIPADTSPKIVACFDKVKKSIPPPVPKKKKVVQIKKKKPDRRKVITTTTTVTPPAPRRLWTWIVGGVGGAALIAAGTFGYLASEAKSDFDKERWADKADELKATVESRSLTANILFGIGGAAMVGAVVLFFVEGSGSDSATSGIYVYPTPLGFEASIRF
jgi:tetratricopeptide (TPR) repeat protein